MREIPRKIAAFVRWLLSPEELPAIPAEGPSTGAERRGFLRWLLSHDEPTRNRPEEPVNARRTGFLRWVWSADSLDTPSAEPHRAAESSPGFWRELLGSDELPQRQTTEEQAPTRTGFVRWVLSSEACPQAPEAAPAERAVGFLRRVLSPETCPQASAAAPRRRTGFLRWLLTGEKL